MTSQHHHNSNQQPRHAGDYYARQAGGWDNSRAGGAAKLSSSMNGVVGPPGTLQRRSETTAASHKSQQLPRPYDKTMQEPKKMPPREAHNDTEARYGPFPTAQEAAALTPRMSNTRAAHSSNGTATRRVHFSGTTPEHATHRTPRPMLKTARVAATPKTPIESTSVTSKKAVRSRTAKHKDSSSKKARVAPTPVATRYVPQGPPKTPVADAIVVYDGETHEQPPHQKVDVEALFARTLVLVTETNGAVAETNSAVAKTNSAVAKTDSNLGTLAQDVKTINQGLGTLTEDVKTVNQGLGVLTGRVDEHEQDIRANREGLRATNARMDATEEGLRASNARMDATEEGLQASQEEFRQFREEVELRLSTNKNATGSPPSTGTRHAALNSAKKTLFCNTSTKLSAKGEADRDAFIAKHKLDQPEGKPRTKKLYRECMRYKPARTDYGNGDFCKLCLKAMYTKTPGMCDKHANQLGVQNWQPFEHKPLPGYATP